MKSSMVICAGVTGVGAGTCGVGATGVAIAGVGCGEEVESLMGAVPCGLDSMRGKSEDPFLIAVPGRRLFHSVLLANRGSLKSIGMPSCCAIACAVQGMNEYVDRLRHRRVSAK